MCLGGLKIDSQVVLGNNPRMNDTRYFVDHKVLEAAWRFFRDCGKRKCEGTGLLIGVPAEEKRVHLTRFFAPEQVAVASKYGACVDLTEKAHYTLTDELAGDE